MPWTIKPSVAFNVFKIENTEGVSNIENIENSKFMIMEGIKYSKNAINHQLYSYSISCINTVIRQDPNTTEPRLILDVPIALDYPQPGPTSYAIYSIKKVKPPKSFDITKECYKPINPTNYFKVIVIASMYDDYKMSSSKHPIPFSYRNGIHNGKIAIFGKFIIAQEIIDKTRGGSARKTIKKK